MAVSDGLVQVQNGALLVHGMNLYFLLDHTGRLLHLSFAADRHENALAIVGAAGRVVQAAAMETQKLHAAVLSRLNRHKTAVPFPRNPFFVARATAFQREVWSAIADIPFGETKSYSSIACIVNRPGAARAVGRACGSNPFPVFVPCHRVVAVHGPGGFAGGITAKQTLLAMEKSGTLQGDTRHCAPVLRRTN